MAQKVDSYFNVDAIKGEIKQIADYMAQQLGNGAKMSTFTSKGAGGGNTKEFDAVKKAMDNLQKKNEQLQAANDKIAAQRLRHEETLAEVKRKNDNTAMAAENKLSELKRKNQEAELIAEKKIAELKANNAAKNNLSAEKNAEIQRKNNEAIRIAEAKLQEMKDKNTNSYNLALAKFENTKQRQAEADARREATASSREAQNASKKIGYLNNLQREVYELTAKVFQLENVESNEAKQLINTLTSKREELAKYKAMWGDHTMRVGEYSRATNGLRLSMGMLVGEMPNAALGMRTFLMSISNNVQGVSQAISAVKAENKEMMDQFQKGLIDKKPDSVFKQMVSALTSFNVVIMVATTLIMVFQDEIGDWVEGLFKASKAIDKSSESMKALIKVTQDYNGQAAGKIQSIKAIGIEIEKYGDKAEYSKKIVDDFNSTFNTHLKTIDEIKKAYPEMAKAAIDSAIKMQAASSLIEKSATALLKQQEARLRLSSYKDADKVYPLAQQMQQAALGAGFSGDEIAKSVRQGGGMKDIYKKVVDITAMDGTSGLTTEQYENVNKFYSLYQKFRKIKGREQILKDINQLAVSKQEESLYSSEANKLFQIGTEKENKPIGARSRSTSQKTLSEINVKEEFYDTERIKLIKELAALEDDTTKSNLQGELNSYDLRTKAMQKYYELTMGLALSDKQVAIDSANEKLRVEKERIQKTHENNVRKFGAGSKEAAQSESELKTGNQTLEHNNTLAIAKINDDFNETMLTANKKYSQTNLAIKQDMYNDELYYLEQAHSDRKRILDIELEEQNAAIERGTILTNLLGKLGIKTNTSFDKIGAKYDNLAKQRQSDNDYYTGMRDSKNSTGEQKKEAQNKLNELAISSAKDGEDKKRETETAQLQIIEDAKASIIENSIDTLKSLWDSYYEYLEEKIEKQQKLETKRNDEILAQFEDETDAGLHTAKELDDFKKRSAAYQDSIDEESARKKEELEKKKFLTEQAFASDQIWIQYAIATMKNNAQLGTVLATPINGWLLGAAIAQQVLVAAQTIPAFAEGGLMEKDGKALMGDGGKHELAWNPRTGEAFITADVPTLYNLDAGTRIFPDVNKLDINSTLSKGKISMNYGSTDPQMIGVLKSIDNRLKTQKQPSLSGVSLMRQMQQSDRYSRRKRGLMN